MRESSNSASIFVIKRNIMLLVKMHTSEFHYKEYSRIHPNKVVTITIPEEILCSVCTKSNELIIEISLPYVQLTLTPHISSGGPKLGVLSVF